MDYSSPPCNLTSNELHYISELQKTFVKYTVQFALIALVIPTHVTLSTGFSFLSTGEATEGLPS